MSEREISERGQVRSSRTRLAIILPALSVLSILATGFIVAQLSLQAFLPLDLNTSRDQYLAAYQHVAVWVLLLAGLGLVVSLGLTLSVVRPLRRLERTFEAISEGQLLPIRDLKASGELDAVTEAFNQMISSISEMLQTRMAGALLTLNREGVVTSCNPAAENLLDVSAAEATGRHLGSVLADNGNNRVITEAVVKALQEHHPAKLNDVVFKSRLGVESHVNLDLWFTQDPAESEPTAVMVLRDLSNLETVRDSFRPFQQFVALGSLSGYVTHEMKNPVHAIQGTAELLARHMDPADPRVRYLNNIQQASEKLVRLIDELRDIASPGLEQVAECQANDILRQAVLFAQSRMLNKEIRVTEEYSADLPRVLGDSHKLFQAFSNIVNNAVDAIPEQGVITVRSRLKAEQDSTQAPPPWLLIEIHNTGSYLDEEQQKRIFEPFHTSKRDGFGLGLWICKKNIVSHNGRIFIESDRETGTSFKIELPCKRTSR